MHYGYDWAIEWRKAIRVCSEDLFDTYFLLSVPTGKITQSDMNFLTSTLNKKGKFLERLKLVKPYAKLKTTLDYLMDKIDKFNSEKINRFVDELLEFGETLNEEPSPSFENASHKIRRLCYHALKRINSNKRGTTIKNLYRKSPAVYAATFFVGYLISEYEDYVAKKETEKPLIDDEKEVKALIKIVVSKIKAKIGKDNDIPPRHLASFLLWLNKFGESNKVKKYIEGRLKNKSGIIEILTAFKTAYFSTGFSDYVSTKHDKVDTKSLDALIGLVAVDKAIEKYSRSFSTNEKKIISLYQESKEDKF
jgi:predicted KAP-like P-loop ATPase